jgi:D-arabinose 1-dehydrogenase-like Zn-dependent alcohol dehydrogenase
MPKLALLTAVGGPIELAEFPLSTPPPGTAALKLRMAGICGSDLPFHLADVNGAFASADAGLVPGGALVP